MVTAQTTVEIGYITKMSDSLWIADRSKDFGGEAKHCASMPEATAFLQAACSTQLEIIQVEDDQLEQYRAVYYPYHAMDGGAV